MSCDIRPTITSTATLYINPYQTPPHCPCRPSSSPYTSYHRSSTPTNSRLCPSHACCSLNLILYRCPAYCRQPIDYHQYTESSSTTQQHHSYYPQHTSRAACSYSYSYTNDYTYPYSPHYPYPYTSPRPRWRTIRIFDRNPDFHALESADLRFAISELVDIGGILLHAESELEKARLRLDRERRRHDAAHGRSCERQRGHQRERECPWTRRIAEMSLEADDIKFSSEVLADCWVKYVGLLRKYEGLGQRRVSGLIEDRGSRRRRRGGVEVEVEVPRADKGKPFRYVSRESWVREKRVPEGERKDRECCREYKKGYGRPEANTGRRRSVRFADEVGGGKGYFNEGGRSRRWSIY
ncbi:uncharacterized protein BDZ83DRAFT_752606 [Colletotrichum acutatum]|uniref:Uncharacterized protein n=1 Tax=Glomerella acutata TaxID=27357 RepID=A0AAD8UNK4_GLOAC|nr:uncharacterized protein BDZ83DRAFT_752606 [Colletotrichum acutatum]KAK1724359.1 hypothetical protein BDZ83DRAFT_752606 [Colletotrichum acutatum]